MLTNKKNRQKKLNPILEVGAETLRNTKQAVVETTLGGVKRTLSEMITGQDNFSPLDTDKMANNFGTQDQSEEERVKAEIARYFKRAKSDEAGAIAARKKNNFERQQEIKQSSEGEIKEGSNDLSEVSLPQGKPKKRMFSAAKVAKRSMVETRAGSGKQ